MSPFLSLKLYFFFKIIPLPEMRDEPMKKKIRNFVYNKENVRKILLKNIILLIYIIIYYIYVIIQNTHENK